jgi:hypothetical protein
VQAPTTANRYPSLRVSAIVMAATSTSSVVVPPVGAGHARQLVCADSSAAALAGTECKDIATVDGWWWINPTGTPFLAYCRYFLNGYWTRVAQEVCGEPRRGCGRD